ncbi:MAG: cohesin domain-containing protein [Candidatus Bathyarchaeia archaeon]|jgi:hypothetical protein
MKNTLAKVISTLMIVTTLLGFAAVFTVNVAKAQPPALLFVDPQNTNLPTAPVGTSFQLNVSVANITMLAGIQFTLTWDHNLLNCTSMTEVFFHDTLITAPDDNPSNINVIKKTFSNTAGTATYGVTWVDGGLAQADGYDPANITTTGSAVGIPSYSWPEGKHGVAAFTFIVLQAPNSTVPSLSSNLHISNDILGDLNGLPIAHTNVDGKYENTFAITPPYFSASSYTAHSVGEIFNVSVSVNNLDASFKAVGFQFSLGYNSTLLQVLNTFEGPWLPPFGAAPNQGTTFLNHVFGFNTTINQDYVTIGDVVEPDANGTWHEPFPSGTGVLAIIEFNATLPPNTVPAPDLTCPLTLFDTIVANTTAAVMPQILPPVSGTYIMKSSLAITNGRVIDIFTGWPAPYGGQGLYQPSDMFWPQKPVSLYANVTYNGYPEQQKDVAFQIIAPNNQTWAIIYATSNVNGTAYTVFTLPWPCDDPQQWFGVWTIIGTVDIACVVVNDTLQFHYDYLARIFKQTTDFTNYNHAGYVTVNVTYGTHLQQTDAVYLDELTGKTMDLSNVTVVITAFDEVRVPYGTVDAQLQFTTPISANSTMEPFGGTVWCQYKNFTVSLTFQIPKFAVAGNSEIDCAVLSNYPYFGGEVISGYFNTNPTYQLGWLPYDPTPIYINPA